MATLTDIDTSVLEDIDFTLPCESLYHDLAHKNEPASWIIDVACGNCSFADRGLRCDFFVQTVLRDRYFVCGTCWKTRNIDTEEVIFNPTRI